MTPEMFCYWLQGYFEIEGNQPRPPEHCDSLNHEQLKSIKQHLALVFKNVTSAPVVFKSDVDLRPGPVSSGGVNYPPYGNPPQTAGGSAGGPAIFGGDSGLMLKC